MRVLAGPATEEKQPQLEELLRRGAQEQHLRIEANAEKPDTPVELPGMSPAPFARSALASAMPAVAAADAHRVDADAIASMHEAAGHGGLRYAAMSRSDLAFRQTLIDHASLVRPLLCWLVPLLVSMRRVGTATTDDCGHFRTTTFKSIFNPDQPRPLL